MASLVMPYMIELHTENPYKESNVISALKSVDVSRFPIPLKVRKIDANDCWRFQLRTEHGVIVEANVPDTESVDRSLTKILTIWAIPEMASHEECVEHIRKACQHFVLHELDEAFMINGYRLYDPHTTLRKKTTPIEFPAIDYCGEKHELKYDSDWIHEDLKRP